MRGKGFEPMKALSQEILSLSRLTASLPSHEKSNKLAYKKLSKSLMRFPMLPKVLNTLVSFIDVRKVIILKRPQ